MRRIVPAQKDDDDFDDDNGDEENDDDDLEDDDDFDDDNEDNDDGVCKRLNSNKIFIENHYWPVAIWLKYIGEYERQKRWRCYPVSWVDHGYVSLNGDWHCRPDIQNGQNKKVDISILLWYE